MLSSTGLKTHSLCFQVFRGSVYYEKNIDPFCVRVGTYALLGFVFAMLLNVISHVTATIALREYAPGVVTAVLINLLVMSYLMLRMFSEQGSRGPKRCWPWPSCR
jgi:Protein of unknown function with HXXEE motif